MNRSSSRYQVPECDPNTNNAAVNQGQSPAVPISNTVYTSYNIPSSQST